VKLNALRELNAGTDKSYKTARNWSKNIEQNLFAKISRKDTLAIKYKHKNDVLSHRLPRDVPNSLHE